MQSASDEEVFDVGMLAQAVAQVEAEAETASRVEFGGITPTESKQARATLIGAGKLNPPVRELCVQNYSLIKVLT